MLVRYLGLAQLERKLARGDVEDVDEVFGAVDTIMQQAQDEVAIPPEFLDERLPNSSGKP